MSVAGDPKLDAESSESVEAMEAMDPFEAFDASRSQFRAQLREVIESRVQARDRDQRIGDLLSTTDMELAAELRALGFDGPRAKVLDLLPLIWVAWADGKVQRAERAQIFRVLRVRGIDPSSPSWDLVATLLESRPSSAYLEAALDALRRLLGQRAAAGATVVSMCVEVAQASGGVFGLLSSVDNREREALEAVAQALGDEARRELAERLR